MKSLFKRYLEHIMKSVTAENRDVIQLILIVTALGLLIISYLIGLLSFELLLELLTFLILF
jgi:hypothetical protein